MHTAPGRTSGTRRQRPEGREGEPTRGEADSSNGKNSVRGTVGGERRAQRLPLARWGRVTNRALAEGQCQATGGFLEATLGLLWTRMERRR